MLEEKGGPERGRMDVYQSQSPESILSTLPSLRS